MRQTWEVGDYEATFVQAKVGRPVITLGDRVVEGASIGTFVSSNCDTVERLVFVLLGSQLAVIGAVAKISN